jgi:predicted Rossmann-fold nucleotide-binding protein
VVTLIQTKKVRKDVPILIYGESYWRDVLHLDRMLQVGTIDEGDANLLKFASTVDEAFTYLTKELTERFLSKRRYWYL